MYMCIYHSVTLTPNIRICMVVYAVIMVVCSDYGGVYIHPHWYISVIIINTAVSSSGMLFVCTHMPPVLWLIEG